MLYCYGPAGDVAHWKQELSGTLPRAGVEAPPLPRRGRNVRPADARVKGQQRSHDGRPTAFARAAIRWKAITIHRVGIIMNGVTGRMGTNQHLLRSIVAIIAARRRQGSATNEVIMPDPILVGRNPAKLEQLAEQAGGPRWTTDLDAAAGRPAQRRLLRRANHRSPRAPPSRRPSPPASTSIAKSPRPPTRPRRWSSTGWPRQAGVKNGVVQDKLWLPGPAEAEDAARHGLLRPHPLGSRRVRLLGLRGRHDPRAAALVELSQGRRRRHHHRHALPLPLRAGQPVRRRAGRLLPGRHAHRRALGRERPALRRARPTIPPTPPSSSKAASSRTSTRAGASASAATTCSCCRSTAPRAAPWPACATAGSSPTAPRRGRSGIPTSRSPIDYLRRLAAGARAADLRQRLQDPVGAVPAPRGQGRAVPLDAAGRAPRACNLPKRASSRGRSGSGSAIPELEA